MSRRNELPDTLGLRIDMVVKSLVRPATVEWASRQEVVKTGYCPSPFHWLKTRPLFRSITKLWLCKRQGLFVGLASASPLHMLRKVLTMFDLHDVSMPWPQLKNCLTASRIRKYISTAQQNLGVDPSPAWRWKTR